MADPAWLGADWTPPNDQNLWLVMVAWSDTWSNFHSNPYLVATFLYKNVQKTVSFRGRRAPSDPTSSAPGPCWGLYPIPPFRLVLPALTMVPPPLGKSWIRHRQSTTGEQDTLPENDRILRLPEYFVLSFEGGKCPLPPSPTPMAYMFKCVISRPTAENSRQGPIPYITNNIRTDCTA